jgi:signal transduction histidine kinase/CheY-like chemotaxis protein
MGLTTENTQRLLVVDDEVIVVSLVSDALEDAGYQVLTATDSLAALELIRHHQLDLIISDIRMPGLNGIELVKQARSLQPDVAVIFITGFADLHSAKDAIQQGAHDYIMKPFELTEIRAAVRKAIEKRNETAGKSSESQLMRLSEMNNLLFTTGDSQSLIISSLRFAMMQQNADMGSVLYHDREQNQFALITLEGDSRVDSCLPEDPVSQVLAQLTDRERVYSAVIDKRESHPLWRMLAACNEASTAIGSWKTADESMILIPIARADHWYGFAMLGYRTDSSKVGSANLNFLNIAASQLAISLENLALLKEAQISYASLKGLQDQTIELEKMATRGLMSAEIGHEMNNFLAVVAGNLQLLQLHLSRQEYGQIDEHIETINDTLKRMTVFTRNLMDPTPTSSNKESVRFDRVLTEVISFVSPQKRFRGIEIVGPGPCPVTEFQADATQIQQLLYNLFNNAADAMMKSATRRITLKLLLADDKQHFTFTLTDTGCGFDPEVIAKAFQERFTTKETGHGFGLVVCRRIIDNHGGRLHLDSIPGQGATIAITFPTAGTPDQTEASASQTGHLVIA